MDAKIKNLAIGVAALIATSAPGPVIAMDDEPEASHLIECHGANSCKGHSECKTSHNSCKGQNGCKGHGWLWKDASDCPEETIHGVNANRMHTGDEK